MNRAEGSALRLLAGAVLLVASVVGGITLTVLAVATG